MTMHEKHRISHHLSRFSPKFAFEIGEIVGLAIVLVVAAAVAGLIWMFNAQTTAELESIVEQSVTSATLQQVTAIDTDQLRHVRGTGDITVVEFTDLECALCQQFHPRIQSLVSTFNGKVRVALAHYPLPVHATARRAARAVECVDTSKADEFAYVTALYANDARIDGYTDDELITATTGLVMDRAAFTACLAGTKDATEKMIDADILLARTTGATGTPHVIVVDGTGTIIKKINGVLSQEQLDATIQTLLYPVYGSGT